MVVSLHSFSFRGVLVLILISILVIGAQVSAESALIAVSDVNDTSLKFQSYYEGKLIDGRLNGPGLPPADWNEKSNLADMSAESTKMVDPTDVPAMTWSYGCSPTSATMMFGYYDRNEYPNMYVGPTNDGVFPLTNAVWGTSSEGNGQCPLTASQNGLDNRTTKGHKEDYYYEYGSNTDPYYNNWTVHTPEDCIADYMGTNMYHKYNSSDGSTWFWNNADGSPLYDFTEYDSTYRDGMHGMRLFAESRGYNVTTNYNQYIYGYNNNTLGFNFSQYKNEIDSGYPVLIQVNGHTMLGVGYSGTDQIVVHNTWDYSNHTMTWGGTYSGMQQYGVGVIHLATITPTPTPTVTPTITMTPTPTLTATPTATPTPTVMINSSANEWSKIIPVGNNSYPENSDQSFFMESRPGSTLANVSVDEEWKGPVGNWTFTNLTSNHDIYSEAKPTPGQVLVFFNATPQYGPSPLHVDFTDLSLGLPSSWNWQFGDGKTSSSQNVSHEYDIPGVYSVVLRATNNQTGGYALWHSCIIATDGTVPQPTPTPVPGEIIPAFEVSPVGGTTPLIVSFSDISAGNPISWFWNFGDGGSSFLQNPVHEYLEPGIYSVTLFVQNEKSGGSITKESCVWVT